MRFLLGKRKVWQGIRRRRLLGKTTDEGTTIYLGGLWRNARLVAPKMQQAIRQNAPYLDDGISHLRELCFIWLFASTVAHEILHVALDQEDVPHDLQEEILDLMLGMMDRFYVDTIEYDWGSDEEGLVEFGWDLWVET